MADNYILYKHTCPNGKVYIGITGMPFERRCGKDGRGYAKNPLFSKAIQKYGWQNIRHEILYRGLTKAQAERKEIELIAEHKSNQREHGYNVSSGGESGTAGVKMDLLTRIKMSEAHKGKNLSDEHKNNLSLSRKGCSFTVEHRQKLSEAKKGKYRGADNPWYGKHPTEDTRAKMRESHLGKQTGANNPKSRSVCQLDKRGNVIGIYDCIADAYRKTGISQSHIGGVCRQERKTAGGYMWRYSEEVSACG